MSERKHLGHLDLLRGIAALAVVLFHFSNSTLPTVKPNLLGPLFSWGDLGVQVFFVISGFVIPFAMDQSRYNLQNAGQFLAKRMVRLGPPSWIAMGLIIMIYYAALWKNGQPIEGMDWPGMSVSAVFANMFYAFDSTGIKPFYSVLWTLEAELQYYVVISLVFPLIIRFSGFALGALPILAGLLLMYPLHAYNLIFFKYIALFVMGITAFLFMTERLKPNVFLLSAAAIIAVCFLQLGLPCTIAGELTMFAVVHLKAANKFATFLGTISYSLYITHHFSGITAEFIVKSLLGGVYEPWGKILLLFIFTAISIAFAYLFFRLVEKPFMQLAARIKFKK